MSKWKLDNRKKLWILDTFFGFVLKLELIVNCCNFLIYYKAFYLGEKEIGIYMYIFIGIF